ncbi:alginate export family protein [Aliidongia dinghuensis]|uniref:Alginate export family protein n=1 Tax=Aliidongia dinghuensis TaxID=1867774 RepID=A0A8J2YQE0_9PROT|nr:alginate export family protein [Aliidongia dinghuensis]GGF04660.1 alginate export family protein [Aliidongia dinghuensis]
MAKLPWGWLCRVVAAVSLLPLLAATGHAQVVRDPPTPFGPLRYDDDFRDPASLTGVLDGLKNIPLSADPTFYANVGGSLRERFESFSEPAFGFRQAGGSSGESYLLHRALLNADVHLGPSFRLFAQLGDELETGRRPGPTPTDVDRLDLAQGFVEANLPVDDGAEWGFRGGRQEMMFGSNRLVDIREGPNIRQSFDGARMWLSLGSLRVDAFWTRPVEDKQGLFDDQPDPTQEFYGVYGTVPVAPVPGLKVDLYWLGLIRRNAVLDAGRADERRDTVGARLFGAVGPVDYNVEGVYQYGRFGNRDIDAFAVSSDTGWTFASLWATPRLGLRADIDSGGNSRGSGTLGTFYPLFPKNNYFTEASIQTPMNDISVYPTLQIQPRRDLAFTVGVEWLWRENTHDGFYQPPGLPVVPGNANRRRYLGTSSMAQVEWYATANLDLNLAYTHFAADGFLKAAGAKDIDWVGVWTTFNF